MRYFVFRSNAISLCIFLVSLVISCYTQAQFIVGAQHPTLSVTLLDRWINTNIQIKSYANVISDMLPTANEAKAFEQLTAPEQDRLVNQYLQKKGLFEPLNTNIKKLGWTGVADYMRTSTQIGNAIAAYFFFSKIKNLTPDQQKALKDREDPVVLAVSSADIEFIRQNEARIQAHIQQYSH